MSHRAIGIYREPEFSPGKVDVDAAILDATLAELAREGIETFTLDARAFAAAPPAPADLVLAMCQGAGALKRLAEMEQRGAVAINSALAIRNCYRDLLGLGLARSGVATPPGALIATAAPAEVRAVTALDLSLPVYVKRGDLHALGADDVQRLRGQAQIESALESFASRGIRQVYVQQEVEGRVVKFYGVSGGTYFSAVADDGEVPEGGVRELSEAAHRAAAVLGVEAWGGDAIFGEGRFTIVDFNDWPSFARVRTPAARAISRRALALLADPR
jgi:glutathione synthase/RimK-type ligase-like ATP-grasp enzyme